MNWEWVSMALIILWFVGMWVAYIICVGLDARLLMRHNQKWSKETAIAQSKTDFWDYDSTAPLVVFFWPVTILVLLLVGIKNLLVWWTNFFIERFT